MVDETCGPFSFIADGRALQMDEHASLPFMRQINIFSGFSAISQPRSNTVYMYKMQYYQYHQHKHDTQKTTTKKQKNNNKKKNLSTDEDNLNYLL